VNIQNSFAIQVSGAPEIDKSHIIGVTLRGSLTPGNSNAARWSTYHTSAQTIYDEQWLQLWQIPTKRNGTAEFDSVDHYTDTPAVHRILDHLNQDTVQFTRHLLIIDYITCSSQKSTNTKWNRTLTNTPGLLPSALFSIPFDFFASVGEIVLLECLKSRTLITLP